MLEMFHLVEDVHGQVNNVVVAQVQGGQQRQNLGIRLACIESQNQIIMVETESKAEYQGGQPSQKLDI